MGPYFSFGVNMKRILSVLVFLMTIPTFAATWTADNSHSTVGFKVKHMMLSNTAGKFTDYVATLTTDDKTNKLTGVDSTIQTKSVDTANEKRDTHLKTADFFDVEKFPTIVFKSKKVTAGKAGKAKITGDLTMHGVTKEVTFDGEVTEAIKDPYGNSRRAFTATTSINRKDFGLTWNKTMDNGGVVVGDKVDVSLDMEFTLAKTEAGATKS